MRLAPLVIPPFAALVAIFAACSSDNGESGGSSSGGPDGSAFEASCTGSSGTSGTSGSSGSNEGGANDAGDGSAGTPAIQYVGRFDFTNANAPRTSWPGGCIVARFEGTGVKAKLGSTAGGDGNETWVNLVVDGAEKTPVKVDGPGQEVAIASGLGAGPHVVEIEKRTEPKWGTLTFEGFTFEGGGKLLAPPPSPARRIEWVAESTIDGFGVEGDLDTTCNGDAPAKFDNARKSVAFHASKTLSAERYLIALSAKGVVQNEPGDNTGVFYPSIYTRTLADDPASVWNFASWTPDVVVISLGGADLGNGTTLPNGFQAAYDTFVSSIRTRYPNAHIIMTIWSQIKGAARTSLDTALQGVKSAHASDSKLHVFAFNEADFPGDETGCYYHANDAHHQETAAEIVTFIKSKTGW